MVTVRG